MESSLSFALLFFSMEERTYTNDRTGEARSKNDHQILRILCACSSRASLQEISNLLVELHLLDGGRSKGCGFVSRYLIFLRLTNI